MKLFYSTRARLVVASVLATLLTAPSCEPAAKIPGPRVVDGQGNDLGVYVQIRGDGSFVLFNEELGATIRIRTAPGGAQGGLLSTFGGASLRFAEPDCAGLAFVEDWIPNVLVSETYALLDGAPISERTRHFVPEGMLLNEVVVQSEISGNPRQCRNLALPAVQPTLQIVTERELPFVPPVALPLRTVAPVVATPRKKKSQSL